jgi:hypothetical protein
MGSLGKASIDLNGEIEVSDTFSIEVVNQVPYALWKTKVPLNLNRNPQSSGTPNQSTVQYDVEIGNAALRLSYKGKPITESFTEPQQKALRLADNFDFIVYLPIEALDFIERQRQDDIYLEFLMLGTYFIFPQNNHQAKTLKQFWLQFRQKYTQKEWVELLRKTGYSDKWIIEIDRPKIEGFNEVIIFLDKASNELYDKKNPSGVLVELRKAFESLDHLFSSKSEKISEKIDAGSPGEGNQPKKSKRVEEIKAEVKKFLQIGPHESKGYTVSYSDALLAYRLVLSLLQYYSEALNQVDRETFI